MRWLPGSLATRLSQPQGRVRLLPELAALSPGAFLGSQPSHLIGGDEGPLTLQNVALRAGQQGMAFGGNGSNAVAYRQWAGVNANTSPAVTLLVVFKNNGGSGQQIAGFGSSSGGPGSTLFRLVQGSASTNAVLFQAQDSVGTVYLNNESSDFGAADGKYHAVVVTAQFGGAETTATYYADGRKLNTIPALAYGTPSNTNFDFLAVLSAYRGGAPLGFSNTDVALFLPLIGAQMPEEWCLQVTANPWSIFAPESRSIWVPSLAGEGPVSANYAAGLEVDSALAPTARLSTAFGVAVETEAAQGLGISMRTAFGASLESDSALAPTLSLRASYGLAVELDAALALPASGLNTYGQAQELDNAYALSAQLRASYGVATEVDLALALPMVAGYAFGTAAESDAASAVSARLVAQYGMAVELDHALALAIAGEAPTVPPQRRLIAIPGGSTAFYVPAERRDFSALDF